MSAPSDTSRARPVIELDGLSVALGGRPILHDLTCALHGRCIGLLGPNGAGKSTLINTLLGFYPVAHGNARIFGRDIRTDLHVLRHRIGYMPENDSFIANMSGVRFVRYMAEFSGLPPGQALERAHEAFFYVGLGEARYRKLGTYSLGMKQMAKLAQAIVHGPKLLFLDEPTNGLDPPARVRMMKLIREIRDTEGVHLILVLAPAARRGRVLRRGAHPEGRTGGGAATSRRSDGPTASSWSSRRWGRTRRSRGPSKARLRVRGVRARALQAGAAGRRRDAQPVPAGGRAERADPPDELPARFARRHLPESDGIAIGDRSRQWQSINAPTGRTRAR